MAIRLFMIFQKVIFSFFSHIFFSVLVQADDICKLPAEKGPCTDYVRRYYFNSALKECQEFIYGGCLGNENNFKTIGACELQCSEKA